MVEVSVHFFIRKLALATVLKYLGHVGAQFFDLQPIWLTLTQITTRN